MATGAVTVALLAIPVAAQAHVHADPGSTAAGSYTTVTFRVPTESDTASTVKLRVALPTATPLVSVAVRPVPGWTAEVEKGVLPTPVVVSGTTITTAPLSVTWTAAPGQGIKPGEFQEFEISTGPLPAEGTAMVLPATQTYSDGSVVTWDETAQGDAEPEHPAPEFTVTAADPTGTPAQGESQGVALWLAGAALVVAVGALAAALVALTRRRGPAGER